MQEVNTAQRTPETAYPECKCLWEKWRKEGKTDAEILSFLDAFY